MGDSAVAVEAVAVKRHGAVHHGIHGYDMTADAVFLDDLPRFLLRPNGVRDLAEGEGRHMVVAGLGLDNILGDESMGSVAVGAGSPAGMAAVEPAFIDIVHHMAVVACGRVVAQVGRKVGDVHPDTDDDQQGCQADDGGENKSIAHGYNSILFFLVQWSVCL